ncbi:MAG TPA: hypothetical protein VHP33_08445 [Polyangiaceae bacterium]|nr:hypothetical protein [Polyangiaceae bacterium]
MTFPAWQLAQRLLVMGALGLAGCASDDDPEVEAYAKLEGVYELASIERFAGACDDSGAATSLPAIPKLWVAYIVEQGVPDTQLHAHGCSSVEQCRTQAADVQADGDAGYDTDFTRYVYSRVADDGTIDGVGVNLRGVVDDKCRLELEETFVERVGDEAIFSARYRVGAEYDPESDGSCATRQDLSDQWRSWTKHECTHFDVVRARFSEDL